MQADLHLRFRPSAELLTEQAAVKSDDKKTTSLRTARLILREWREDDLQSFADLNADSRVMEHFPKTLSRSESNDLASRIRAHFDAHGFGLWAVDIPDVAPFAGFVGLSLVRFEAPFTPNVEVGWRIAYSHWNNGYATEGTQAAIAYAFSELGLPEIISLTVPANLASRRVMEKIGMSHDPVDDFNHPALPDGHALRRHVLYRLKNTSNR